MEKLLRRVFLRSILFVSVLAVNSLGIRAGAQQPVSLDVPAPELIAGAWLNTPKGAPITLASRKGKVTVVEFWTFG